MTTVSIVLCCMGLIGSPAAGPSPVADQRTDVGQPADIQSLHAALAEARRRRQTGQSGHGDLARRAAWQFYQAGHPLIAIEVLGEVIANPESTFDLISALRMQGQYLRRLGRAAEAIEAFERLFAIVDQHPELVPQYALSYASAVEQYVLLLDAQQRYADAAVAAERVLGAEPGTFDDRQVKSLFTASIRALERSGDPAGALAKVEQLLERFPECGRDERACDLLALRARLRDPSRSTDGYIAELRAIWADPELGARPGIVEIGRLIADAYRARGLLEAAVQQDALTYARATALLAGLDDADPGVALLEESQRSLLGEMASAHRAGRPDIAEFALLRLIERAPTAAERADLEVQLQAVREGATPPAP